jgi:hypothetical protein
LEEISLTPGFSRVWKMGRMASRFNGFSGMEFSGGGKTVETVFVFGRNLHRAEARC